MMREEMQEIQKEIGEEGIRICRAVIINESSEMKHRA